MINNGFDFDPLRRTVLGGSLGMAAGLTLSSLAHLGVAAAVGDFDRHGLRMIASKVSKFVNGQVDLVQQSLLSEAAVRVASIGTNSRALGDLVQQDFEFDRTIDIHGVIFSHSEIALLIAGQEGRANGS